MSAAGESAQVVRQTLLIINEKGLHARAAAKFVATLNGFESEIDVEKDGTRVSGRSIMGLMMLAAAQGTTIAVEARGHDAVEAVGALATLVENRFDE